MEPSSVPATNALQQLAELYGGGPLAALIATLLFAVAMLFVFLQRSQSAHLSDARLHAALAEKMTQAVEGNTRVLHEAIAALRAAGSGRRGSRSPSEAEKVAV